MPVFTKSLNKLWFCALLGMAAYGVHQSNSVEAQLVGLSWDEFAEMSAAKNAARSQKMEMARLGSEKMSTPILGSDKMVTPILGSDKMVTPILGSVIL